MVGLGQTVFVLLLSAAAIHAQCILTAGHVDLLSAEGLATPWELSGQCFEADPNTQSFVEATIYEPKKNMIYAYSPLVITKGTKPLVRPVHPKISKDAVIVYHFGCNANTLTLADKTNGATLKKAHCVNGAPNSVFGQFAYCNGVNFFKATERLIKHGHQIPPLGKARDGTTCPTTRSFAVVDQDQSDNVVTTYLLLGNRTAQNTAVNRKRFPKATVVSNPSDNALLSVFIDPAIGCKPFQIPSLDDPGSSRSTVASDELSAAVHQAKPVALVPPNDPMVLNNGHIDIQKVNLYRQGVFQPPFRRRQTGAAYCKNLAKVGPKTILRQGKFTAKVASPMPATATTLFTFLGTRLNMSWVNLNCPKLIGKPSPIIANVNGSGVTTSLTFFINGKTIGPVTN